MKRLRLNGFTIVEVTIIIVVIAILATITAVAYNGLRLQAVEASMKSDLQNAATQLEKDRSRDGTYPFVAETVNDGAGFKASTGNTLGYHYRGTGYCVSVTSTQAVGTMFFKENAEGDIEDGTCPLGPANVTTLAGSTTAGYVNGAGTVARFDLFGNVNGDYGWGIDISSDGSVYIVDQGNNVIRKMTTAGVVSTIAGMPGDNGEIQTTNGLTSAFDYPVDLAIVAKPGSERLLVSTGACLRSVTLDGVNYGTDWVNGGAVAPHDDHMECSYSTQAGTVNEWSALYRSPVSVVVDSNLNAYVYEAGDSKVRKMLWNTSEAWWDTVSVLSSAGSFEWGTRFGIDPQDRIYGASGVNKIVQFTTSGTRTDFAGSTTSGDVDGTGAAARFNKPLGIDVDGDGNVYVADCGNHSVRRITPAGAVSTIAGSSAQEGHADGYATSAQFYCPVDLAVNVSGTLIYVMDARGDYIDGNLDAGAYIRQLTL